MDVVAIAEGKTGKRALRLELRPGQRTQWSPLVMEIMNMVHQFPNPDNMIRYISGILRHKCNCSFCDCGFAYCSQYILCMWDRTKTRQESSAYSFFSCQKCKVKFFEFLEKNYPHIPFAIIKTQSQIKI